MLTTLTLAASLASAIHRAIRDLPRRGVRYLVPFPPLAYSCSLSTALDRSLRCRVLLPLLSLVTLHGRRFSLPTVQAVLPQTLDHHLHRIERASAHLGDLARVRIAAAPKPDLSKLLFSEEDHAPNVEGVQRHPRFQDVRALEGVGTKARPPKIRQTGVSSRGP